MPIYEYICDDCKSQFEKIVINRQQEISCPKCSSKKATIQLSVFSSITGTTRHFSGIQDLQKEVEYARMYAGFHYHHSLVQGFVLGHKVAHNVANNYFQKVK